MALVVVAPAFSLTSSGKYVPIGVLHLPPMTLPMTLSGVTTSTLRRVQGLKG